MCNWLHWSLSIDFNRRYFRERSFEIYRFEDNLSVRWNTFLSSSAWRDRSRRTDCRKSNRNAWRKSISVYINIRRIRTLLRTYELYVKHSDDSTYGTDLYVHCTGHGRRSESSFDGLCYWRFLCIRNTDWYAG